MEKNLDRIYTYVNPIMYVYVCICMHTYTFIYILIYMHVYCTYIVIYIVRISVVYCMYIYVYTYLHVYFVRKIVSRIDTCIYGYTYNIHRIYISYTSGIHTNTYNIHTIFLEPVFFVYVYWCQYMHVYAVYWRIFGYIRTVTKKYVRSRYMHVYVRIHKYMHVCHILATRTG